MTKARASMRRAAAASRVRAAADRNSAGVWSSRVIVIAIAPSSIWRESNHKTTTRGNPPPDTESKILTVGIKSFDIGVETYKDVVQLSGFVNSDQVKARASEVAAGVSGVRSS